MVAEDYIRTVGRYDFEGGSYVLIQVAGNVPTEDALEMAEVLIAQKRKELARIHEKQPQ